MLFNPEYAQNVPKSLKALDQWVNWDMRSARGHMTKVPVNPHNVRQSAKSNDPRTWGPFALALGRATQSQGRLGIGIVFTPPLVGIDLDKVITEAGELLPWAQDILERLKSCYQEYSPSRRGFHVYAFGPLAKAFKKNGKPGEPGGEMYTTGRFFTVTGDKVAGSASEPGEISTKDIGAVQEIITKEINGLGKPRYSVNAIECLPSAKKSVVRTELSKASANGVAGAEPQGSYEDIIVDMDDTREPPFEAFSALYSANPMFGPTWDRHRKFAGDQSDSSYIMALANWAVFAGWDDQSACRLLLAWYRKHNLDAPHLAKVRHTIWTAREDRRKGGHTETPGAAPLSNEDAKEELAHVLGLEIVRLVQVGKNHATYRLHLASEVLYLGEFKAWESQQAWRKILQEHAHVRVAPRNLKAWEKIMVRLSQILEVEELPEISQEAELWDWLDDYAKNPSDGARAETIRQYSPFVWEGALWVNLAKFSKQLKITGVACTRGELIGRLTTLGAEPKLVYRTDEHTGKDVKRPYWRIPKREVSACEPGAPVLQS